MMKPKEHSAMMQKEDRQILETLAERIRVVYPAALIWAFGSRARGNATWESDFDICIVLPEKNRLAEQRIREICWEVGFERERVITTVIMDRERFEYGPMSESTLVENILREGIAA